MRRSTFLLRASWAAFVVAGCSAGRGTGLPGPVIPQGVGVNIHFARGHERELDMIAAAGFKVVRMDFDWGSIERKRGEYIWSAYDELTSNLEKRGLRPYYILDYSNALYEQSCAGTHPVTGAPWNGLASPQQSESVAAFARWAGAAAARYRGRRVLWEIWNEPNIGFWKPKPDARQYAALALAAARAVRAADPQATLLAPAAAAFPWEFLDEFFAAGTLDCLDAVSVHPYRGGPPETAAEDYRKLRELIDRHAPPSKKGLPILSGEWGYSSHAKGVAPDVQAAFLARQQLVNLLCGVPLSIWYDWKNDGTDPGENEHNFGVLTHDLQPKPAYLAVRTLTRELDGFRVDRRLPTGSDEDYVLVCVNAAGERKLAAWTTGRPRAVALEVARSPGSPIAGFTGSGEPYAPKLDGLQLSIDLAAMPKYIALGAARVADRERDHVQSK